jgi:hypothetical protein
VLVEQRDVHLSAIEVESSCLDLPVKAKESSSPYDH